MEIISPLMLYFWTRLDGIINASIAICITTVLLFVFGLVWSLSNGFGELDMKSPDDLLWLKKIKALLPIALLIIVISSSVCLFLPNKKDAAMIWIIPKLANSETLQREAADIYDTAKEALKTYIGEEK